MFAFQELLEKKVEYCQHLLKVAKILCPGPSEMRGYLLWELVGVRLRLAQWHWIRMKITTPVYLDGLIQIKADLEEVVYILGSIRQDSDEGQMGQKARVEYKALCKLIKEMSQQTYKSASTLQYTAPTKIGSKSSRAALTLNHRTSMVLTSAAGLEDRFASRRSICIL